MGSISYNVWLCGLCARPRNRTLYDIPPILFVFKVTQKDLRSSLKMAGYVICVPGHVTTHYMIYYPFDLYFK
jgi:hypothetical protein